MEGVKIRKYLVLVLLIFGLTLSIGVHGVSAATVVTESSINSGLSSYQSTTTASTSPTTDSNKLTIKSVSKTVSSSPKTIKVLIYNGHGAIIDCVVGVEKGLKYSNSHNLVPGYRFSYSTTKKIRSSTLYKFNVLVMPGGSSGSKYIHTISGSVIRKYVSSGHGYLGICAGAYSGSKHVYGMYNGWGVAPHVYCRSVTHEGNLKVSITSSGSNLFGIGGLVTLAHYNGPAMYAHGGSIIKFATYADNTIKYINYAAIVGDKYGKGRTVLSGPHPELQPQNPNILSKLIAWAAKVI